MISTCVDDHRFLVRLAATPEELHSGARVRCDVYSTTDGLRAAPSLDHSTGLDVDAYDFWAHHLVLVLRCPDGEQVVGTMRVVMNEPSPQRQLLLEALAPYPHLIARLHERRPAPLPMLSYLAQADVVRAHHDAARASGLRMAEPGRLAVTGAAIRLAGRARVRLGDFFVRSALAYGFGLLGLDRVYVDCDERLAGFYRRHGFDELTCATDQPSLGIRVLAMTMCPTDVPVEMQPEIARMTSALNHHAAIHTTSLERASLIHAA